MSQEQLAEQARVSRRGIADLERGARRHPYPETSRRLVDALGLVGEARAAFLAAAAPGRERYRLALEPEPVIGRAVELSRIEALAREARALTLTGPGGIGKTRLALELARRIEPGFADGALVVDLAACDAGHVVAAVAAALGQPAAAPTALLRHANALVVLDNCEHVLPECVGLATELIRSCPGVRLVVTSQEALRIPGELVFPVPPLTIAESAALFLARARATDASAALTEQLDAGTVAELCRRLEGIPLAIELAAARMHTLGLVQLGRLLADRLGTLPGRGQAAAPRHRTMRAVLDWSFALLDEGERELLARLAVFAGGWTMDAARGVCADEGLGAAAVIDALAALVEKSLVQLDEAPGAARYRFLETVRGYAAERFDDLPARDAVRERHAAFLLDLAEDGGFMRLGVHYPAAFARIAMEEANLRVALQHLATVGHRDEGARLCRALSGYWLARGRIDEGEQWFVAFGGAGADAATECARGRLAEYGDRLDEARERFQRALRLAGADPVMAARALSGLGDTAMHRGDAAEALAHYRSALTAARSGGAAAEAEAAQALLGLGRAHAALDDPEARDWLEQALRAMRALGDPWAIAYALNELGGLASRTGELERARTLLEECHVLWRAAGTLQGERAATMNLAMVSLRLGATERAGALARDGLELGRQLHDFGSASSVRCLEIAALVLAATGDAALARTLVTAAEARREELGAPRPDAEQASVAPLIDSATRLTAEPLAIERALDLAAGAVGAYLERI